MMHIYLMYMFNYYHTEICFHYVYAEYFYDGLSIQTYGFGHSDIIHITHKYIAKLNSFLGVYM